MHESTTTLTENKCSEKRTLEFLTDLMTDFQRARDNQAINMKLLCVDFQHYVLQLCMGLINDEDEPCQNDISFAQLLIKQLEGLHFMDWEEPYDEPTMDSLHDCMFRITSSISTRVNSRVDL